MQTAIFTHPACLLHHNAPYDGTGRPAHPECPERLQAVLRILRQPGFANLLWREALALRPDAFDGVHAQDYVRHVLSHVPENGLFSLDPETSLAPGSDQAALHAAGAVINAIDAVMRGDAINAFCAVRPPGHHAAPRNSSGFCIFNNIALGAHYAQKTYGLKRIAIIDFDVHHGDGTAVWAAEHPEILFISSHEEPLWPFTGHVEEIGKHGNLLNITLPSNSGGETFRYRYESVALPRLEIFQPELILISAGFDAHQADPLASLTLSDDDFNWVTAKLCACAARHSAGKVVSSLEGGYNVPALASAAAAHVQALMTASANALSL